jgi:2-polyprenyl-3-methyl-5-hydroxy-6-metoxy-1,4-benzoquinol methylase
VLSNIHKDLGPDVEVRVGLPAKNPWSLPFGHKQLFAERIDEYDLFIYAEDDILISQQNIEAFLLASEILPDNLLPGFVHGETDDAGNLYYDPIHSHFHWDPASVGTTGDYTFAFYTNEHSACFLLTREQLKRAIQSGGFMVPPHEGKYDMLCAAATDPYTQCGFRKMICISHLEDFTVRHLPNNKHSVRPYRARAVFDRQIEALLNLEKQKLPRELLFTPETKVLNAKWSKDYYEPVRDDVISLIPATARNVLSIGCGWGATERQLVMKGLRVVGLPMDSVIAACAEEAGVSLVYGDFATARHQLEEQRFDCILFINVLHLLPDPEAVLSSFSELLSANGVVIIATPNFANAVSYWRRLTGDPHHKQLGNYDKSGLHLTSPGLLEEWFSQIGLKQVANCHIPFERTRRIESILPEALAMLLSSELVVVAKLNSQ